MNLRIYDTNVNTKLPIEKNKIAELDEIIFDYIDYKYTIIHHIYQLSE